MTQLSLFKVCLDCGEAKPPEDFVRDKTKPSGRRGRCMVCQRVINQARERQRERPNRAAEQRAWHAQHPDKRRAYRERWETANPEKAQAHRDASNRKRHERELAARATKDRAYWEALMRSMFLDDEQKKALTRGLKGCPKELRADIRDYIDLLSLEWGMIENVFRGYATIVGRDPDDGSLLFKMTRAGGRYVEEELLQLNGTETEQEPT